MAKVTAFYNKITDEWETRTDEFYLKYEKSFDVEEFKGGRNFPVRSIYDYIDSHIDYLNADTVEEDVMEDMEYSGRCEMDELIHYLWESAKYPSILMRDFDGWYD